jgi:hypothetical protein
LVVLLSFFCFAYLIAEALSSAEGRNNSEIRRIIDFPDPGKEGGGRGRREGKGGSLLMKQLVHFPSSLGSRFPRLCSSSFLFSAVFAHVLELFEVHIFGTFAQFLFLCLPHCRGPADAGQYGMRDPLHTHCNKLVKNKKKYCTFALKTLVPNLKP